MIYSSSSSSYIFKETPLNSSAMVVTQEHEVPSGWPLGLENMNIRLRVSERSQVVTAAAGEAAYRLYVSSPSFSSFSSSNLDTEVACGNELCGGKYASLSHCYCFCFADFNALCYSEELWLDS